MTTINSFREDYYFLSNFYEAPITYNGITYRNNEAAFQAQKSVNPEIQKRFSNLSSSEAKHLGRQISLRPDWEAVKVEHMKKIVRAKFDQHPELKEKLLATKDIYLEEGNTWGDRIWGTVNGNGANLLGKILMETREELKELELEIGSL